jgi:hypothetical protein
MRLQVFFLCGMGEGAKATAKAKPTATAKANEGVLRCAQNGKV